VLWVSSFFRDCLEVGVGVEDEADGYRYGAVIPRTVVMQALRAF
jgi:hypothetical protein